VGQTWCAVQYLDSSNSTMLSVGIGLGSVSDTSDEICQDTAIHLSIFQNNSSMHLISAVATLIPNGTDPVTFYEANTWSRPLNDSEKDLYYCVLSGSGGSGLTSNFFQAGGDWLINLMPSSPDAIKIPNQIVQLTGEGTLASNLLIELYSAGWQTLAIFCLIKFYNLIPFKST